MLGEKVFTSKHGETIITILEKNRRSELNSLFDNFNQIINI